MEDSSLGYGALKKVHIKKSLKEETSQPFVVYFRGVCGGNLQDWVLYIVKCRFFFFFNLIKAFSAKISDGI